MKLISVLFVMVILLSMISCYGRSEKPVYNGTGSQDVIVSGFYSWGFEVSDFQPCGVNEKWWVVGTAEPELSSRYRELTSEAYEQVYARLKGIKSAPGHYGHLGAYDRQFEVREVLELRPLQNGDCK